MGGTACLNASIGTEISGLVMLSSPMNIPTGPIITKTSDVEKLTIPKIIMFTEEDIAGQEFVDLLYILADKASEPKSIYTYPGTSHGADLFYAEFGEEVLEILLNFVKGVANY
jgi:hypothetical protein